MSVDSQIYAGLINRIRQIHTESGAKLLVDALTGFPTLNPFYPSMDGSLQLVFFDGVLNELLTPEGSHPVLGSHTPGDCNEAMLRLQVEFGLELVSQHEEYSIYRITRGGVQ